MPFGYSGYERPDAARIFNTIARFDFDPSEDLAKADAYSLRESGLFKDAFSPLAATRIRLNYCLRGKYCLLHTKEGSGLMAYQFSDHCFGLSACLLEHPRTTLRLRSKLLI